MIYTFLENNPSPRDIKLVNLPCLTLPGDTPDSRNSSLNIKFGILHFKMCINSLDAECIEHTKHFFHFVK